MRAVRSMLTPARGSSCAGQLLKNDVRMLAPRSVGFRETIVHAWLAKDDLTAGRLKREWDVNLAVEGVADRAATVRWHKQQQKAAASRSRQLAAQGPGTAGTLVKGINPGVGNVGAQRSL